VAPGGSAPHPGAGQRIRIRDYGRAVSRARWIGVAAALAAAGCGDDDTRPSRDAGAVVTPTATPAATSSPEGCEAAIPDAPVRAPRGLIVPRGSRVLVKSVRARPGDERLTIVEGYIEEIPDDLIEVFEAVPRTKLIFKESEGFEAEVMLRGGGKENFWKAIRACEKGSRFTAVIVADR